MRIWGDLSCTQDPLSAERGIPTYAREFARAMERTREGLVDEWVIDEAGPVPAGLDFLLPTGRLRRFRSGRWSAARVDPEPPDVYHDLSPFNGLTGDFLHYLRGTGARWIVTLYDLIPLIFRDVYLTPRGVTGRYLRSLSYVQHADHVLCISESAARDAQRLLGIRPDRLTVVGTGVEARYRPPASRRAAFEDAVERVPGLREGFLMYTGGIDHRKNMEGLLEAFSLLPERLRHAHQLVVVCRMSAHERGTLAAVADRLGISRDVLMTGFVSADAMLSLYQSAHLFVFPSLYEGFGLPVAEALSCGTPCVVADNSSLVDLMPLEDARFDASDPRQIADTVTRALEDDAFRADIARVGSRTFSWDDVAARSAEVYERLGSTGHREGRSAARGRPRIAFVTPMPPAESGVADYSMNTLRELAKRVDVDVFAQADAASDAMPGVRWFHYRAFEAVRVMSGDYDRVIFASGNSDHHFEVLELLRQVGSGTVIAHDVNLQGMSSLARKVRPGLVDEASEAILRSKDAGRLPDVHRGHRAHATPAYYSQNFPLSRPWVECSDEYVVHSRTAASLVELELPPDQRGKLHVMQLGHLPVTRGTGERDAVVSMGILVARKNSLLTARAFARLVRTHPRLTFALVGADLLGREESAELAELVRDPSLEGRLVVTGRADRATYDAWLDRALVAVQLRTDTNGESSASLADAFSCGAAVVTSEVGAMAELPADTVTRVRRDCTEDELVAAIASLVDDDAARSAQQEAAYTFAERYSFEYVADELLAGLPAARR